MNPHITSRLARVPTSAQYRSAFRWHELAAFAVMVIALANLVRVLA